MSRIMSVQMSLSLALLDESAPNFPQQQTTRRQNGQNTNPTLSL